MTSLKDLIGSIDQTGELFAKTFHSLQKPSRNIIDIGSYKALTLHSLSCSRVIEKVEERCHGTLKKGDASGSPPTLLS